MPHFSTTQIITTGGRLGHDRIGLLCYVHIIKKPVNIGIYIGGFTVTSYAVSRGHPAPLVGKRLLADGLRVYFGRDSYLVYIHFAHTQDHDYVLYLCGGTSGIVWMVRFSLLSSKKKRKTKKTLVECVQL